MGFPDRLRNNLSLIYSYYLNIGIREALKITIIISIIIIGVYLRLLPLRFGAYISEFDPYLQYYATKVIVDGIKTKGLAGFFDFFNHHISLTWQPEGVNLGAKYYPGVPYIGALVYLILNYLGFNITLTDIGVYLPVVFSIFGILSVYIIGREIKDEFTGFISSLFYSISPSVIPRSNLGWYDTDGFGLPLMLISIAFFIKGIKNKQRNYKLFYGVLAGLAAGMMGLCWGGFTYLYTIYAVYTITSIFIIDLPENYEYVYIPLVGVMEIMVTSIPRSSQTYLTGTLAFLMYISIILVLTDSIIDYKTFVKDNLKLISTIILLIILILIVLPIFKVGLEPRALSVVYPAFKEVSRVVSTVQEQAGASFAYFFRGLFLLIPFSIYGFYVLVKKINHVNLFIILFSLTSIYASSNLVRLVIISTPFLAIVGSYGVYSIYYDLMDKLFSKKKPSKFHQSPGIIKSILIILTFTLILLSTYFSYSVSVRGASYPVTILTGGSPYASVSNDWFEALEWMKANVPKNSIVAAWWDYGYWISFIGGKKSLADNGTLNSTRITELARMFLSDEETGIKIMKKLGADYILIYLGTVEFESQGQKYYALYMFGEDGKFVQMAKIAGIDYNIFLNRTRENGPIFTDEFWNTFLGHLIPYEFLTKQTIQNTKIDIYKFSPKYPLEPDGKHKLILVYRSNDPAAGEVLIYKLVEN